jgi:dUTP pyrophosphatase
MQIKIKRLKKDVALPTYAKLGDAAMDVVATSENVVEANDHGYIEYGTGLAFELPEGYYMDIRPRSSISNTGMILANGPGTLDSGYKGELKLRFKWIKGTKKYNVGDRVAQIMIKPYPFIEWLEVDELSKTERNEGAFGSTNE